MTAPVLDIDAYLRRIGCPGRPPASLEGLAHLIEHHAAAIPFENLEVLAGRVPRLDLPSLQHKLVQRPRGGYCFEQNGLFLGVLRALGFEVQRIEARVRAGVPNEVVTGRTHLALRVRLDGEDWLADVGFGGLAPQAPLRLAARDEQRAASGAYRLVEQRDDALLLQHRTPEGWSDCYRFGATPPEPVDLELANWFVATHPDSMLGRNLLVARGVPGGRLRLFNRRLARSVPETAAPEEQVLRSQAELRDALADLFGLAIDTAELDAVQRVLDAQPEAT
jgi:N-hydroxyarylamine O-acetyltransferase